MLVWGSDWPVTGVATPDGIETAVTHRHPGGRHPSGREDQAGNPDQRLSLDRALAAFTSAGAVMLGESARQGSIEVGKDADLVLLGRNLVETPPGEIHRASAQTSGRALAIATAFEGRHRADVGRALRDSQRPSTLTR